MKRFTQRMQELNDYFIALRRSIHAFPELGFEEFHTTDLIMRELRSYGVEVVPNGKFTGAVGILRGPLPGKTLAFRADIDALPIQEETELSFASRRSGYCHACGHDIHTAALLATAKLLSERRQELRGTVKFIFQPAEEKMRGSYSIIENDFLKDVDAIFGAHTWPDIQGGHIGVKQGAMMAGFDSFKITLLAKGGHAAHPHKTADPIVAAAYMITQLQTLAVREISPLDSAVVTVGKMLAGTAGNIIPSEVTLEGTLRYLLPETGAVLREGVQRIVKCNAEAMRVNFKTEFFASGAALVNNDNLVKIVQKAGELYLGPDKVDILPCASMGSEDFAAYLQIKPGAFFRLGTGDERRESRLPLHNGKLLFNENAISAGALTFCGIAFMFYE